MAYNQNNLFALWPSSTSGSWQMFAYRSADSVATVVAAGYITNPLEMGLSVGDTVIVIDTATPAQSWCRVTAATATSATLSAGVAIT